jgi:hypothetical protein
VTAEHRRLCLHAEFELECSEHGLRLATRLSDPTTSLPFVAMSSALILEHVYRVCDTKNSGSFIDPSSATE